MSAILAHCVALLRIAHREELSQSVVKCKAVETSLVKNESKHNIHGICKTYGMHGRLRKATTFTTTAYMILSLHFGLMAILCTSVR